LEVVDENVLWGLMSFSNGVPGFIRTTNAGENWYYDSLKSSLITAIYPINSSTAYIGLFDSLNIARIIKTSDSGVTWNIQPTAFGQSGSWIDYVYFFDDLNGFAFGDPINGYCEIYTTTNGGDNWVPVPNSNIPPSLNNEYPFWFSYSVYENSIWIPVCDRSQKKCRIFKSTDRGYTWTATNQFSISSTLNIVPTSIVFKNHSEGILVFSGYYFGQSEYVIYKSTTGGTDWSISNFPLSIEPAFISNIRGTSSGYFICAPLSNSGTAYSTDGGNTWAQVDDKPIWDIDMISASSGWAAASPTTYQATIYKWSEPAQVNEEWVSRYNGPANDYDGAHSVAVDGSGNVYVTGGSYGSGSLEDYSTVKYNSSGEQQWASRYDGPGNHMDRASSIAVDGSGNVYVTGFSRGLGSAYGYEDYATIKYNSFGVQQWASRYDGSGNDNDEATSIGVDGSGNVYVTGYSLNSEGNYDYVTIKYNSSGLEQWISTYNGPANGNDKSYSMAVDVSGNVYVTGESYGDFATVKYNSSGVQQWVSRYSGPGDYFDEAFSLAIDLTGNVYVTGYISKSGPEEDYVTIKYNSEGVQQWVSSYDGIDNRHDIAFSVAVDGTGNVYVTGYSSRNIAQYDCTTIKYSSDGVEQWVSRFSDPDSYSSYGTSIAVDGSDNAYVTGYDDVYWLNIDYLTIKYNSAGIEEWAKRYSGSGNDDDYSRSIAVDGSGNVYVTGESRGPENWDYTTIKYSQSTSGVYQNNSDLPEGYSLSQNYPNPFNPSTTFRYSVPQSSGVVIKVFDILGREIATLVHEEKPAGTYEVTWYANQLPSGVYFYQLKAESFIETKKMLLLK
jgi:uncharacterized delta-60 repeat protein